MPEKILGQPAHPIFVHFPVAFFLLSSFLLVLHRMDGKAHRLNRFLKKIGLGTFDFESFSVLALLLGFGMGVVAILSGLALVGGWEYVPVPHGFLGLGTESCYFAALVIRWVFGSSLYGKPLKFVYFALHFLGVILVVLTGFEGGELHLHG